MVKNVFLVNRNGIYHWLLLRISAIFIMLYVFYILIFMLTNHTLTYDIWHNFFSFSFTKVFTMLTLFFILIHGWIGMWQVLTDYIKNLILRLVFQILIVLTLISYVCYGFIVVWSV